jgi:hypothetical protein
LKIIGDEILRPVKEAERKAAIPESEGKGMRDLIPCRVEYGGLWPAKVVGPPNANGFSVAIYRGEKEQAEYIARALNTYKPK